MRLVGIFLSACVILAAMKAAIVALSLLFLVSLLWGFCLHPREVAAFVTFCALLSAFRLYPGPSIAIIGLAIIAAQFAKNAA